MRCFPGVPSCKKDRIQASPVPSCRMNEDLFVMGAGFQEVLCVFKEFRSIPLQIGREIVSNVFLGCAFFHAKEFYEIFGKPRRAHFEGLLGQDFSYEYCQTYEA
ncbi:hypothetical protein TNCV_4396741 [Trichonephila clavipes]|uniref:Uncharacterized protein n=1 Tax=Trichonephila clavipes TaxID=2585209 RepID=A0A8X6W4V6_TRICX|nr:hypothetical protein TNCV_4396741 [Trichonephila clavipes]